MPDIDKPKPLEQREIEDRIESLRSGVGHQGTCGKHSDLVEGQVLNLRIGEQLLYRMGMVERGISLMEQTLSDTRYRWLRLLISPAVTAALVVALVEVLKLKYGGKGP